LLLRSNNNDFTRFPYLTLNIFSKDEKNTVKPVF
jgi:hypothetical protein